MARKWYVARAVSGQEHKVVAILQSMKESGVLTSDIGDIHIPIETVASARKGKQYIQKRRLIPGYFLMEIDFPEEGWRNTVGQLQGIDGFVGFASVTEKSQKPEPISEDEVRSLLEYDKAGGKSAAMAKEYVKGEQVKINTGPFSTFNGRVVEVVQDRKLLRIEVEIFGRVTPIELGFDQVDKL